MSLCLGVCLGVRLSHCGSAKGSLNQLHSLPLTYMYIQVNGFLRQGTPALQEGFAPFCSHLIVPNFAHLQASYLNITPETEHLLRCVYNLSNCMYLHN